MDILLSYHRVINLIKGCTDESGVCRPFGAKVKDENNPCIKYKCTRYGTMVPVIVGTYSVFLFVALFYLPFIW